MRYAGLIGAGIAELLHLKYLAPASVGAFFEGVQGSGMRRLMRQGALAADGEHKDHYRQPNAVKLREQAA